MATVTKDNTDYKKLSRISLFAGVEMKSLLLIAEKCVWLSYDAGAHILQTSDDTRDIFFVVSGAMTINHFSDAGREVTYTTIPEGGYFGEFSAIDGRPRSANVIAKTDSVIARLSSSLFRQVLYDHPGIALRLCEHLVAKNRELTERVFEFSTYPVAHRVRLEIARIAETGKASDGVIVINPAPTHYELATRTSTHREAVSRELGHLSQLGIIEAGRRTITVLRPDRLRRLIQEFGENG